MTTPEHQPPKRIELTPEQKSKFAKRVIERLGLGDEQLNIVIDYRGKQMTFGESIEYCAPYIISDAPEIVDMQVMGMYKLVTEAKQDQVPDA